MDKYKRFITPTFWGFSFPLLMLVTLYHLILQTTPTSNPLFLFLLTSALPMVCLKSQEIENKAYENCLNELREMNDTQFFKAGHEIRHLPLSRPNNLYQEAFRQVYREKNARNSKL